MRGGRGTRRGHTQAEGLGGGVSPWPVAGVRSRRPQGRASPATELGRGLCLLATSLAAAGVLLGCDCDSGHLAGSAARDQVKLKQHLGISMAPRAESPHVFLVAGVTFCLVPSSVSLDARAREVKPQTTATSWKKLHLFTTLPLTLTCDSHCQVVSRKLRAQHQ